MDFSDLITALQEGDSRRTNELIEALRPRLISFLRAHLNASKADAQDCAQEALLKAVEVIKEDRIKDRNQVVHYIMSICKNNYLTMLKKQHDGTMDDIPEEYMHGPQQLQSLLDEEQEKLLEECMNQLKDKYQRFMEYWFEHPDAHTQKVADEFDISKSNAWTRKHRIIKKLNECYRKKSKL